MSLEGTRVVFVAGLSGSGKTTCMAALEDLGFYCVDNLPPMLIEQFIGLCEKAEPPIQRVALAIDTREATFLRGVPAAVEQIRHGGARVSLVFLDSDNESLVNRYRETRRVHPHAPDGTVEEGIEKERSLLVDVSRLADFVVETSRLNVHQLRDTVIRHIVGDARSTVVNLISFGFRLGLPGPAELLFDVRFLPNPYFDDALRDRTGDDPEVSEFVLKNEKAGALLDQLRGLLAFLLPLYDDEGKAYLTIAIGCTGGRHRSVAVVNQLVSDLQAMGREVNVSHRDSEKTP